MGTTFLNFDFQSAISKIREWRHFPLIAAGGIGFVLILSAALFGFIQDYFDTEEFYVFHYASNLPHIQAWQQFFIENARLIEGIYWTYVYEFVGFNPLLIHSFSFFLLLSLAIAAAACFLNVWPQQNQSRILPYLLVFSFFINWVSAMAVFRISYDNTHLSMLFFFIAGLALQRWAVIQRARWLLLSFLFFLASVLTYENATFLFPALIFLAWPLLKPAKDKLFLSKPVVAVGLAGFSGLVLLLPRLLYSFSNRNSSVPGDTQEVLRNIWEAAPVTYLRFGQFLESAFLNFLIGIGLLTILIVSIYFLAFIHSSSPKNLTFKTNIRWTCIILSCTWFLVFGPLPYVLLGYDPGPRIYSSAVFGIFPLTLIFYEIKNRAILRTLSVALLLCFSLVGLQTLWRESIIFKHNEPPLNIFFRGLVHEVPHVRPHTVFIFINGPPLGISGCGPSLEMLYAQQDLKCGSISSTYDSYFLTCPVVRNVHEIEVDCQRLSGENWILLTVVDNVPHLIDELKPGDFGLVMSWKSPEPLRTDYQKIVMTDLAFSDFYLHLLSRSKVLFGESCADCRR